MGQMMGIVDRVDWEDRIPKNIRFMRIKVRIDPWLPVIAGFTLRLDDGSRVWVQCRYKRVHKLCTKCGLIGHTRGQCTHAMDDVELMLYRQRLRIQELHHSQYRFDGLQPQFTNELRAYHNHGRRWATQVRFGPIPLASSQTHHPNHSHGFPDPSTPHSLHAPLNPPNQNLSSNPSIIQNAINMLNLNVPGHVHLHASYSSFVFLGT